MPQLDIGHCTSVPEQSLNTIELIEIYRFS